MALFRRRVPFESIRPGEPAALILWTRWLLETTSADDVVNEWEGYAPRLGPWPAGWKGGTYR